MLRSRRAPIVAVVVLLAACHGIDHPTSPAPAVTPTLAATGIALVATPPQLPIGGGSASIRIETTAGSGFTVAPRITVQMQASAGELSAAEVTTDATGHASVEWQGSRTGTITATTGEHTSTVTIRVLEEVSVPPPPAPAPPGNPNPNPNPNPTPAPNPNPTPPPGPPPTPPAPPGDLVLSIGVSNTAPNANDPVTLSAALTSSTGASVPTIERFIWDVNGDKLPDRSEASPVVSYPAGTYTIRLAVLTADGREVLGSRPLTVGPTPVLSASLAASPTTTTDLTTPVNFTATTSSVGATGAVTSYGWDFTADGTIDQTTAGNTMSMTYTTIGAHTARVTAHSANGQSASATATVTVTPPPLVVNLGVAPSGSQPAGTPLTITATVTSTGPIPASMTFAWDYNNDGTTDEVTTGGSPRPVVHSFNTSGTKTVRVSVTSPDGRTATNTTTITVS